MVQQERLGRSRVKSGDITGSPEEFLLQEWKRQAQKLAGIFAREIGQTTEEYIAKLPKFDLQPEEYKGRLDIPVIVETRFALSGMLELLGIYPKMNVNGIKDWEKGQFTTPEMPYVTWANDGSPDLNRSANEVRRYLKSDERGGTVYDGIALYVRDSSFLDRYSLVFPGSQVGSIKNNELPELLRGGGVYKPRLYSEKADDKASGVAPIIAGRKIKVKS